MHVLYWFFRLLETTMPIPAVSHVQQKPVISYLFPNTAMYMLLYSHIHQAYFSAQKGARCFINQLYCIPK